MTVSYSHCPVGHACMIAAVNDINEVWSGNVFALFCFDSSSASTAYLVLMMCMLFG